MIDPVEELTHDSQRLAAAEGLRWILGELLVGDIGVVFRRQQGAAGRDLVEVRPKFSGYCLAQM